MGIIYHRLPLFAGLLLLQVSGVAQDGLTMSDQVLIVLLNAPAYAIVGFLFYRFMRFQSEESERRGTDEKRRDDHESKLIDMTDRHSRRIDGIEEDRRRQEERRQKHDAAQTAALVTAIENSTQMVSALEARSSFLLQSDQEISQMQTVIRAEVKIMFDRFVKVFPDETSLSARFDELKNAMIAAIEKACEEKKHKTGELPLIVQTPGISVSMNTPTPDAPPIPPPADNGDTNTEAA